MAVKSEPWQILETVYLCVYGRHAWPESHGLDQAGKPRTYGLWVRDWEYRAGDVRNLLAVRNGRWIECNHPTNPYTVLLHPLYRLSRTFDFSTHHFLLLPITYYTEALSLYRLLLAAPPLYTPIPYYLLFLVSTVVLLYPPFSTQSSYTPLYSFLSSTSLYASLKSDRILHMSLVW